MSLLEEKTNDWISQRMETISILLIIADQLDEHHKNTNIAKVVGSSTAIAGAAATIGGILLAPFTAGASLALFAGGIITSLAGSATHAGAGIAEYVLSNDLLKKAKEICEKDIEVTNKLKVVLTTALSAGGILKDGVDAASKMVDIGMNFKNAMAVGNAANILLNSSKLVTVLNSGVPVISAALGIIQLVISAKDLSDDSKSEYSKQIRDIASKLRKELD